MTIDIPEGGFRTIYADPAWPYRNFTDSAHGAVNSHYPTMTVDDICKIPVGEKFANKSSVLLLWATGPHMDSAMKVIPAWGYEFVTMAPWLKSTPSSGDIYTGIGFWFQSTSEYLLVAKRGKAKKRKGKSTLGLLVDFLSERSFCAPRKKHSEKPTELHTWIEYNLDGPYLDLFARKCHGDKWTSWGYDLGYRLSESGVEEWKPGPEGN